MYPVQRMKLLIGEVELFGANQDKKQPLFLSHPLRFQTLFTKTLDKYSQKINLLYSRQVFFAGKSNRLSDQDYNVAIIAYLSRLVVA